MYGSLQFTRKVKNSTSVLFVLLNLNIWLVILSEAANVKLSNNRDSNDVLASREITKAQERLISPLCVQNGIQPKILRYVNVRITNNIITR